MTSGADGCAVLCCGVIGCWRRVTWVDVRGRLLARERESVSPSRGKSSQVMAARHAPRQSASAGHRQGHISIVSQSSISVGQSNKSVHLAGPYSDSDSVEDSSIYSTAAAASCQQPTAVVVAPANNPSSPQPAATSQLVGRYEAPEE